MNPDNFRSNVLILYDRDATKIEIRNIIRVSKI